MKTIEKYLMTIAMIMIIANIVTILQNTRNMSVKHDSLRASLSNQVEFCLSHNKPPAPPTPVNNNSSIVNSFHLCQP